MTANDLVPGTAQNQEGRRSIMVKASALGRDPGYVRMRFGPIRSQHGWRCLVTGEAIPTGTDVLIPLLEPGEVLYEDFFCLSLDGWRIVEQGQSHQPLSY